MEPRHSCFIKAGIRNVSMIELGPSSESFLITTDAGMLSIMTPDLSGCYRSKPLEYNAQRVVASTPALKPNSALLDLAFSASSSGVISADPLEDCLYTINDLIHNASLLSAISMCRLTTSERRFISMFRERKCNMTCAVPPIVLLAQQTNILAYKIPTTASVIQNQAEAFWVPTGDIVMNMSTFLPLASRIPIDGSSTVASEADIDYFVVSRDRYGRYFRGEELLAEKRLHEHVLHMKTLGRFILLVMADYSLYLLYLNDTSILQLHRFPSDLSLIDACLLEKPPSNILLEKQPLSTSASFKDLEKKTIEQCLGLDHSIINATQEASTATVEGIPVIVKLYSDSITLSILTFHPTTTTTIMGRSMPSIMELTIYRMPIALQFSKSTVSTESIKCIIDSGTLSALPNKSLLWIMTNSHLFTFSAKVFSDIYSMLSTYNFRGYVCHSKYDFSQANDAHDIMQLLAKKRTLMAQLQLLQQQKTNFIYESDANTGIKREIDVSKEYTFEDLLRETRLLNICCSNLEARSNLASLSCFYGYYLIKISLPEQLFIHSLSIVDPKTGIIDAAFSPLNFKDTIAELRKICNGTKDNSAASSLGPIIRDSNLHIAEEFSNMLHKIRYALICNEYDQVIDVTNDMSIFETEIAQNIVISELSQTHLSEKCTALLPILHHVSHHSSQNVQPVSIIELPISSDLIEKYSGSSIILQLSVAQTNLSSASYGISIPIPVKLPMCPLMRFCSSSSYNTLMSFEGVSLASVIEESACLTMNFSNYKIVGAKLGDILRNKILLALPDDYDGLDNTIEQSNAFTFFVEHCSLTSLLKLLLEVSNDNLPLAKLLGYSIENKSFNLLAKTRLSTIVKVHCLFENFQLTKIQLSGLDIHLLVKFAQNLTAVLLPDGADLILLRTLCSSFSLGHRARSFLTAVKTLYKNLHDQLENVTVGLSELSSHMLLDCDQMLDLTNMCFYRRALDQLQTLRNSVRITVKQALDAQESNRIFSYCQAYLSLLESSLLLANSSKANDIKSWLSTIGNANPSTLEWNE